MSGRWRAWLRLFAVQGAWNYERMLGIGVGYALEPLVESWSKAEPSRHAEVTARSAQFFNCHPYLAGVVVGAESACEAAGEDGDRVVRLRAALSGTLGAIGDQLFWAGLLPALMGIALILSALGVPWWGVVVFLVAYNGCRVALSWWCLQTGLTHGLNVGGALGRSILRPASIWVGVAAGFLVGAALPLVAASVTQGLPSTAAAAILAIALVGLGLSLRFGSALRGLRLGMLAVVVTLVVYGVTA